MRVKGNFELISQVGDNEKLIDEKVMDLLKNMYIRGILDVLKHILIEELSLEKINEFYRKIIETINYNYEERVLGII